MRVAQGLWPIKTDMELSFRTKANDRTCRFWLNKHTGMHADHLVALMRSDPAKFVPVVLGPDAYAALAREVVRQSKLEELKAAQETQRALIERLERGAAE